MKNVKNNKLAWFLRKYWIVPVMILALLVTFIVYRVGVSADSTFSINITATPGVNSTSVTLTYSGEPENGESVDYAKFIWKPGDPLHSVFQLQPNTGTNTVATNRFAGSTDLYSEYSYNIVVDGETKKKIVRSNSIKIDVPLKFTQASFDEDDIFDVDGNNTFSVKYNGFIDADYIANGGTEYDSISFHPVALEYNKKVVKLESITPNSDDSTQNGYTADFKAIYGGNTVIGGTVDGMYYEMPYKVFSKVKFKVPSLDLSVKDNKGGYPLSNYETNIHKDNFGQKNEDGTYSVYFWTEEDYRKTILGITDIVPIIEVTESGVIIPKYAGSSYVYASCKPMEESYDRNGDLITYADKLKVNVKLELFNVEMVGNKPTITANVGNTIKIESSAYPSNLTSEQFNNQEHVIEPHENKSTYSVLKAGTASIMVTVRYKEYATDIADDQLKIIENEVTVIAIDNLSLSSDYEVMKSGESVEIKAMSTSSSEITWTSDDETVATVVPKVTEDGQFGAVINGVAKGVTYVRASQTINGIVKSVQVKIEVVVPVDGLTLSEPRDGATFLSMELGKAIDITAFLEYETNDVPYDTTLDWSVSDETVVTVDNSSTYGGVNQVNKIRAVGVGKATLTVLSRDNNRIVSCEIVVFEKPTGITLETDKVQAMMSQEKIQLKATITSPHNGAEQLMKWRSQDTSICTVDEDTGLVTLVAPGKTTISVTSVLEPSIIKYIDIVIVQDVKGIKIDQENVTFRVGETYRLTSTILPEDAYDKSVIWTSSNTDVVKVENTTSYENLLTAVSSGSAVVMAKTVDGGYLAFCNVRIIQPVTSIKLNIEDLTVKIGTKIYLTATVSPSYSDDKTIVWTSSDNSIATVADDGTVEAVSSGSCVISAINPDSKVTATCTINVVNVLQPVTQVALSDNEKRVRVGTSFFLYGKVSPDNADDPSLMWSSSDNNVATVEQDGKVTAVAEGTCTITAINQESGKYDTCVVTCVNVLTPITEITLNETNKKLKLGNDFYLIATVLPEDTDDRSIQWSSSDMNIATVDEMGKVTAVSPGVCTITATNLATGVYAECKVTCVKVLNPIESITLNETDITVRKDSTYSLYATFTPEDTDDAILVWSSDNENIATVENGKVIPVNEGICTITVKNEYSNVSATCKVTVIESVSEVLLNTYYQNMIKDTKFVLIPTIVPDTAVNKNVSFISSDTNVATVDSNGVVSAINGGVCEIVVTSEDGKKTAKCTIVVTEYVSSIELSDEFKYINKGASYTFTAKVGTETASNKNIVWASSDPNVVEINQFGVAIGHNYGSAVITVTAADGSGISDSCIVKVINPVRSIKLDKTKITMYVGDVENIKATITPEDATVQKLEWTSSDPAVAKVFDDGDVEAVGVGRCKIYAKSMDDSDIIAECTVIVQQKINASSVSINSKEILMLTGKTRKLSARLYPLNASETVNWLSTDTSVVVVEPDGQITTVGPGTCEVVAYTTYGTIQDSCRVYSMAISKSSLVLEQYDTFNLYVDGAPANASWRTSNPRIATVTQGGVVTGRMPGECIITATVNGKTVTCNVTIKSIDPDKFIIKINQ